MALGVASWLCLGSVGLAWPPGSSPGSRLFRCSPGRREPLRRLRVPRGARVPRGRRRWAYGLLGQPVLCDSRLGDRHQGPDQQQHRVGHERPGGAADVVDDPAHLKYRSRAIRGRHLTVQQDQVGVAPLRLSRLHGQHAKAWTIKLRASDLRLNCFGVYPLTVQVTDASGDVAASDPVPMPFWPNKAHSCPGSTRPDPFAISWVWPLIDSPHQGPCPGLLDNSLAPSLAPGGRLAICWPSVRATPRVRGSPGRSIRRCSTTRRR